VTEFLFTSNDTFRVLGSPLLLNLLGAFLALALLGAGLDERTQTPLGAHQQRISIANKGEHGRCDLEPNYVS
jgi:hypothetical protein